MSPAERVAERRSTVITDADLFCFQGDFLSSLRGIAARLRTNQQANVGERRQRRPGPGYDFLGYKEYEPGDDLRHLEVHKLETTARPLVRQFEATARDELTVLLDNTSSMSFGATGPAPEKSILSVNLAAATVWVAALAGAGSHVGLLGSALPAGRQEIAWSDPIDSEAGYFAHLRHFLRLHLRGRGRHPRWPRPGCAAAFWRELRPQVRRQHLVLVSDLWYPIDTDLVPALQQLAARFRNLYLLHVLAERELTPPPRPGPVTIIDAEYPGLTRVAPADPGAYSQRAAGHAERVERLSRGLGFSYRRIEAPATVAKQRAAVLETVSRLHLGY